MKKIKLNEMQAINGGLIPSGQQVTCWGVASIMGLLNPVGGIVVSGICLFMN